jgi:multidrug efflux pump subunit AcrA (membrane-fusion protein)
VLSMPLRGSESGGMSVYQIETTLEQEGSEIRSGMLANVRFVVGEKHDVLTIPAAAVQYRPNNETYVYLRTGDGKTQEQTVEIGLNDGIMAEVLSGLSEGQTVLVPLVAPMDPSNFGPGGVMVERVVVQ